MLFPEFTGMLFNLESFVQAPLDSLNQLTALVAPFSGEEINLVVKFSPLDKGTMA